MNSLGSNQFKDDQDFKKTNRSLKSYLQKLQENTYFSVKKTRLVVETVTKPEILEAKRARRGKNFKTLVQSPKAKHSFIPRRTVTHQVADRWENGIPSTPTPSDGLSFKNFHLLGLSQNSFASPHTSSDGVSFRNSHLQGHRSTPSISLNPKYVDTISSTLKKFETQKKSSEDNSNKTQKNSNGSNSRNVLDYTYDKSISPPDKSLHCNNTLVVGDRAEF